MARKMKDSGFPWIGEVPDSWEVRKVKHYYSMQTGFTPDTKNELFYDDDNGFDWINISDIKDGETIYSTKKKISQLYVDTFKPQSIPEGSLLYSFKLSVGQTAFAGKEIFSNEAIAAFLQNEHVNLHYLKYSSMFIVENAQTNIYNAKILNQALIANAYIPFPPIDEQEKIASFLDSECSKMASIIASTHASIDEYKKLKQAVITQAVTKGVRGDRPMKDSGIEWIQEIPAEVKISRVGLHFDIILGKMICSELKSPDMREYPYYCAANVHFDGVDSSDLKKMWFTEAEIEQYQVKAGDLLVVEGGAGAGGCAIADTQCEKIGIQNSIQIVRAKTEQDIRFLCYYLQSIVKRKYIDVVCNKATIPHFTKDKLANVPYPLWTVKEQSEIADYLDKKCAAIDNLIAQKEKFLLELEDYKKSMIYEYVTGKKEVPNRV